MPSAYALYPDIAFGDQGLCYSDKHYAALYLLGRGDVC